MVRPEFVSEDYSAQQRQGLAILLSLAVHPLLQRAASVRLHTQGPAVRRLEFGESVIAAGEVPTNAAAAALAGRVATYQQAAGEFLGDVSALWARRPPVAPGELEQVRRQRLAARQLAASTGLLVDLRGGAAAPPHFSALAGEVHAGSGGRLARGIVLHEQDASQVERLALYEVMFRGVGQLALGYSVQVIRLPDQGRLAAVPPDAAPPVALGPPSAATLESYWSRLIEALRSHS